jgi:hypothetical protein
MTFEIFITDLNHAKQVEILEFLGVESIEDGNYDIVPIAVIEKPIDEEPSECSICKVSLNKDGECPSCEADRAEYILDKT